MLSTKTENILCALLRRANAQRLELIILCLIAAMFSQSAYAETQISQFGITWTFNRDYPVGQFANGDWWVVGPVTITGISPRSTTINGRTMNGRMVNPSPRVGGQGYDSAMENNVYWSSLN